MSPATTPPSDPAGGRAWEATATWATGVLAVLRRRFMHGRRRALPHLQGETIMLSLAVAVGAMTIVASVVGTGDDLPPINGLRNPTQATLDGDVGTGYAAVGFLVLLAVAKLVAICLSTGSGNAIGTFARAIFLVKAYQQAVSRSPAAQQRMQYGEVVMPNGDTLLQAEDEVTVLADLDHIDDVHGLLAGDAVHPTVSRG